MDVKHFPPRKKTHITRDKYQRDLAICFGLTILFLAVLVFITVAFGQEHPFPFKTLTEIEIGTTAWNIENVVVQGYCQGSINPEVAVTLRYWYVSGAESHWVVYTDGELFGSAYFPPGAQIPIIVVTGHIKDGKVVVEKYTPFTGAERPCDRWNQRPA